MPAAFREANPELSAALIIYNGLKMEFTTTPEGEFKELLNWEEVRQAYVDMAMLSFSRVTEEKAKEIMNKTLQMFNTREIIENTLIKEIRVYYSPFNTLFTREGFRIKGELPSPFGGEMLPGYSTQQIMEIDPGGKYYLLSVNLRLDSINIGQVLKGMLQKVGQPADSLDAILQEVKNSMQLYDKTDFCFLQPSGWIRKMTNERFVEFADKKKTDKLVITLKE